jgi:sugar phosphate isomerase/epimerase
LPRRDVPGIDEAARRAADDDNRRAVDEALAVNAACLVLVVGGLPGDSKDIAGARSQVRDGLGRLLEYSRKVGMPLAIEPLHPMYAADRACINTLEQANDLCDELGDDGLGMAVDLYHTWWDPSFSSRSNAPDGNVSWVFISATGWCRHSICCSIAA